MAAFPDDLAQEGHQLLPAAEGYWRHAKDRVVHAASDPQCRHYPGIQRAADWAGRTRRNRRRSQSTVSAQGQTNPLIVGRVAANAKKIVFGTIERDGELRVYHVPDSKKKTLAPIILANIKRGAKVYSDEGAQYYWMRSEYIIALLLTRWASTSGAKLRRTQSKACSRTSSGPWSAPITRRATSI